MNAEIARVAPISSQSLTGRTWYDLLHRKARARLIRLRAPQTSRNVTKVQHRTPHRSGASNKPLDEYEHEHGEPTQLAGLRTCSRAEFRALSLAFFCRCFAIAASCSAARGDCTTLSRADGGAAHAPGPHKHTSCRISYRAQN